MLVGAPGGSNLLVVASKNHLTIDPAVGEADDHSVTVDMQAVLTSEGNVVLAGTSCGGGTPDKRFNFEGTIITNALKPFADTGGSGGKFVNDRSLCADDQFNPVFTLKPRFDFVPQLTDFYKEPSIREREIAP